MTSPAELRCLPVGTEIGDGFRVGYGGVLTASPVLLPASPLSSPNEGGAMPAVAEKPAPKSVPKKSPAKKKTPLAKAKEGSDEKLAKFLLAHVTYPDSSWADRAGDKSRRKGESREAFIQRVLRGEEAPRERPQPS